MSEVINVMVNGLPGKMASLVAERIVEDERFRLVPYSLTGPEAADKTVSVGALPGRSLSINLVPPEQRVSETGTLAFGDWEFIAVDFTHPSAVNDNAEFYCRHGLPFVMGTTGGDRKRLAEIVAASGISAVIAPNMAKQVVGFQAMMEHAAANFPGLFAGYSLKIRESHQQGKADTSGTAKAMVQCFNKLGLPFTADHIVKVRDPAVQQAFLDVPARYLDGHGWHTYTLISPDGTVKFEFTHNVNGRDVYAKGALDAIAFLDKKVKEGAQGRVFTMIDVLKG